MDAAERIHPEKSRYGDRYTVRSFSRYNGVYRELRHGAACTADVEAM